MALPATDDFNRANEDPLAGNWTTVTGRNALKIVSNAVRGTVDATVNASQWNADTFADDQYSQVKCVGTVGNAKGPMVRVAAAANTFYTFIYNGTNTLGVYKCLAGTTTQIGANYSHTFVQNEVLKLAVAGQDADAVLTPYINGVEQATRAGVATLNSGSAGMRTSDADASDLDDWEGGNVAGGETITPDKWHPVIEQPYFAKCEVIGY